MKPSRFTIELDIDGGKYLYNSLSNAYAKVDEDHYETYLKIKNNNPDYDEKMSMDLYNGGFVINDNEDEIGYMNFFEKVIRYGSSSLGLTIAPILQCNFRCKYCYEAHENSFMSNDVQKLLIEFVTKNISRYKNISVSWYGGEPLLAYQTIVSLSKELINMHRY